MLLALLFLLGLICGSFANALAYRLHEDKDWLRGRSECEACGHKLAASDLIPLLSWLSLRGKCRYCHKSISWGHPAAELVTGLVFAVSYIFWPTNFNAPGQAILFATWLAASVGLVCLAIYDLRWMLLPSLVLYVTLAVSVVGRLAFVFYQPNIEHQLVSWLASVVVASGLFAIIYISSRGRWIGEGDITLGLITGTLLASPAKAFLMIFAASLLGSVASIYLVLAGRHKLKSKIAFGPFLITGTFLAMVFGQAIIDWYNRFFLGS